MLRLPRTILTPEEAATYALIGKRFRRRRRIGRLLMSLAWLPAVAVLLVVLMEAR